MFPFRVDLKLYGATRIVMISFLYLLSMTIRLVPDFLTLMQRVQDCAVRGFRLYVTGQVAQEKWPHFAAKMTGKYELDMSDSTRSKRRLRGESVCRLYACPVPEQHIVWVMMVTDGIGRVHGQEDLKAINQVRLEINGYELVHDGTGWSWQMTANRRNYWKDRILEIAKRPPERRKIVIELAPPRAYDQEIETVMDTLYRTPGFRPARRQVGRLVAYAKACWKRYRPASDPKIRERTFLPYVRRLSNVKKTIDK